MVLEWKKNGFVASQDNRLVTAPSMANRLVDNTNEVRIACEPYVRLSLSRVS